MKSLEIKVPVLPESIADATVLAWHKQVGDPVKRDDILLELETDKVVLEVPALEAGVLQSIEVPEGSVVQAQTVLGRLDLTSMSVDTKEKAKAAQTSPARVLPKAPVPEPLPPVTTVDLDALSPSSRRRALSGEGQEKPRPAVHVGRVDRPVPMSRLRAVVAERLVQVQQTAALLTTFNEVNMQPIVSIRQTYKDSFEKKHAVKLGFMSFFARAVIEALKRFPVVNASVDDKTIVYHDYYDLSIAVSTERGLVVPVIRNADRYSMADLEKTISGFAIKARDNKLSLEDLQGGTFTLTNGGVFGSLLSTPILNPPQVAILGMHKIEERAVVEGGQIVIRPMMYLALTYDHRVIDGKDSVQFLVAVKQLLEDPIRLLIEV